MKVEEFETVLKRTIQDVEKGKDWSKTIDDGVLVTILEWLEKMEAQMAKQELEIVELRHQVGQVLCPQLNLWLTRFTYRSASVHILKLWVNQRFGHIVDSLLSKLTMFP